MKSIVKRRSIEKESGTCFATKDVGVLWRGHSG